MNLDDLTQAVVRAYGKRPADAKLTSTRAKQYRRLFGKKSRDINQVLGGVTTAEAFDALFAERLRDILRIRPALASVLERVSLVAIEASGEVIKAAKVDDGRSFVLMDTTTATFIWMMNKAFIYGQKYLSAHENRRLYAETFLHFATLLRPQELGVYPRPRTPPHRSIEDLRVLSLFTEIQERFLLYHELAHIIPETERPVAEVCHGAYLLKQVLGVERTAGIQAEVEADEVAFDMVLDYYGRTSAESVETVSVAVFLLIRYFMWTQIVFRSNEEDRSFAVWLARNSFFREKIAKVYTWGPDMFIVDLFESHLEPVMESAALVASTIFRGEGLRETANDA